MNTKERVVPQQSEHKKNIYKDLLSLGKNTQFLMIFGVAFFLLILVAMRGAVAPFYVTYFLGREELVSIFISAGMIASFLGALSTNLLSQYFCKVKLFKWGAYGIIIFHAVVYFFSADQIELIFIFMMLAQFCQMITVPLMFSMVADTADFGESVTGDKTMAMSYATHLLAIKLGLAVGGALVGWLLSYYGYIANVAQTEKALNGIVFIFSIAPTLCGFAVLLCIWRYRLTDIEVLKINQQLLS